MECWSYLANDILEHITSFLPFPDLYRFGAVCKNWRLVAKQKRYRPSCQIPWLVLGDIGESSKHKFYSLSENKHYSIDIPELHGRYICGSSHGWLIAVDIKITGILINPFTRECYELPPFPPYSEDYDMATLTEEVPSDYTGGPRDYTLKEMQTKHVHKAILSHDPKERPDFTAMVLVGEINTPAFWRPGDTSWTIIKGINHRMDDVIYFKENFYIVSAANELYVVNFGPDPEYTEVKPWIRFQDQYTLQKYLMEFKGKLLFIDRFSKEAKEGLYLTYDFDVTEVNLEKGCTNYLDDIDNCVLFLGRNSSVCVNSTQFPGCRKNGIYFTHLTTSFSKRKFGSHDLGIFDITDGTVTPFYSTEAFHPHAGSPIWLVPNPW